VSEALTYNFYEPANRNTSGIVLLFSSAAAEAYMALRIGHYSCHERIPWWGSFGTGKFRNGFAQSKLSLKKVSDGDSYG
jgi:hypothetical protein